MQYQSQNKYTICNFMQDISEIANEKIILWQNLKVPSFVDKSFDNKTMSHHLFAFSKKINTKQQFRQKWHKKDKQLLLWITLKYCQAFNIQQLSDMTSEDREKLASILEIDEFNFLTQLSRILEWSVLKFPFSKKEIIYLKQQLSRYQNIDGTYQIPQINWRQTAFHLNTSGINTGNILRNYIQVKQLFSNYLNPQLTKEQWTQQEDLHLMELFSEFPKKWTEIAYKLGNRNQCQVKNRYNQILYHYEKKISRNNNTLEEEEDEEQSQMKLKQKNEKFVIDPEQLKNFIKTEIHQIISQNSESESVKKEEKKQKVFKKNTVILTALENIDSPPISSCSTSYQQNYSFSEITCFEDLVEKWEKVSQEGLNSQQNSPYKQENSNTIEFEYLELEDNFYEISQNENMSEEGQSKLYSDYQY